MEFSLNCFSSLDNRLTDGGKVVSPMHRPHFTPQKLYFSASGTHFCQRLSTPQVHSAAGRIAYLRSSFLWPQNSLFIRHESLKLLSDTCPEGHQATAKLL
jgi:hypothetical protein